MNINTLNKSQCVAVLKAVTGSGGDYARVSLDEYRRKVKLIRNANPDAVDAALMSLSSPAVDKDAMIKALEGALRDMIGLAEEALEARRSSNDEEDHELLDVYEHQLNQARSVLEKDAK